MSPLQDLFTGNRERPTARDDSRRRRSIVYERGRWRHDASLRVFGRRGWTGEIWIQHGEYPTPAKAGSHSTMKDRGAAAVGCAVENLAAMVRAMRHSDSSRRHKRRRSRLADGVRTGRPNGQTVGTDTRVRSQALGSAWRCSGILGKSARPTARPRPPRRARRRAARPGDPRCARAQRATSPASSPWRARDAP